MNTFQRLSVLCIMALIPILVSAQDTNANRYKKTIILSSGDTTVVVNRLDGGLSSPESKFLHKDKSFVGKEVFYQDKTDYKSLEEAAYETRQLLQSLEAEDTNTTTNSSLGFRASQVERMRKEQRVKVKSVADSLLEAGEKEKLAQLYVKFGKTPTYYLNGVEVSAAFIGALPQKYILNHSVKVRNTLSGNPNGEIWYNVSEETFKSLDLSTATVASKGVTRRVAPVKNELNNTTEPASTSAVSDGYDDF